MHRFSILILGFAIAFFSACKEEKDDFVIADGTEYFPLAVGKYIVYQVDSVIFDPVVGGIRQDSSTTFMKEEFTEKITDENGGEVFKIERSERKNTTDDWQVKDVWYTENNDREATRTEENLRFLKLVFPVSVSSRWEATKYFGKDIEIAIAGERIAFFKGWSSEILAFDQPERIGNFDFDEVLTVTHADAENLIELREVTEKYARNVGLVQRELRILDTNCIEPCRGQTWEQKAEAGLILKQTILEFN